MVARVESDQTVVELRDVVKSLGGKAVLNGLSFDVRKGETLSILGPSGGGKTVLLRHIVGLLHPDRGTVRVLGVDLAASDREALLRARAKIGYLFQGAALLNSLTVGENIALPLRERGERDEEKLRAQVAEQLSRVGLPDAADQRPGELSGGMRKRAGLARALAGHPELLLCDEPTAGLDPPAAAGIGELLLNLRDELGKTSVVVTHDLELVFQISSRIALLHEGRIHTIGPAEDIRRSEDPVVHSFLTAQTVTDPASQKR